MSSRGRKSTVVIEPSDKLVSIKTYHFTPSDSCIHAIAKFANEHREEKSKHFKASWELWTKTPAIHKLFVEESERLLKSGYDGDLLDKLYFSARYYYRKKSATPVEKKPRKTYEATDSDILERMNRHILEQMKSDQHIRPSAAYEKYKRAYSPPLDNDNDNDNDKKTKKIYKNRFFSIRKKIEKTQEEGKSI